MLTKAKQKVKFNGKAKFALISTLQYIEIYQQISSVKFNEKAKLALISTLQNIGIYQQTLALISTLQKNINQSQTKG